MCSCELAVGFGTRDLNAHAVERTVDEDHRDQQEGDREAQRNECTLLFFERDGQGHGQQAEQGRELDDRIQRDRRGVFERITDGASGTMGEIESKFAI